MGNKWVRRLLPAVVVALLLGAGFLVFGPAGQAPPRQSAQETVPIGGDFTLVNQAGETVTQADFRGRYMLIYFGYTYCPDVCPTSLQTMTLAYRALPEAVRETVQMVFFTVDPERDTVDAMADYVSLFDQSMIGLTGTKEQTDAAAEAFGIYARKAEDDGSGGYLMDHSSIVYLMGPDGRFVRHFSHGTSAEAMAEGLESAVSG